MDGISGVSAERIIDGKFKAVLRSDSIKIVNIVSGAEIPDDEPLFLLRARDELAEGTLFRYTYLCQRAGCTSEHLQAVRRIHARFLVFSRDNSDQMKLPGITGDFETGNQDAWDVDAILAHEELEGALAELESTREQLKLARAALDAIHEALGEPAGADDTRLAARVSQRIVELNDKCTKAIDAAQRWLTQLKEAQEIVLTRPVAETGEQAQAALHEEFQRVMEMQEEEREGHVA